MIESNYFSFFVALTLVLGFCDGNVAQANSPRRLRVKEATPDLSANQIKGRNTRKRLLRVENVKSPNSSRDNNKIDSNTELKKLEDEEALLWDRFLGEKSFGPEPAPAPTLQADTPPPVTPAPIVPLVTPSPTPKPTEASKPEPIPSTPQPTKAPATPKPTEAPAPPAPTGPPPTDAPLPGPGPAEPLYCGCFDCSQEVWDTVAGGFTCGERIIFVAGMGSTQEAACALVGGTEFPQECGACDPQTCDGRDGNGRVDVDDEASPAPTMQAEVNVPVSAPTEASPYCSCDGCTEDVWNTMVGLFTCGQLIESIQDVSREEACTIIGGPGSEFAEECSPCDSSRCAGQGTSTTAPSFTPTNNDENTIPAETRCGCSTCGGATLNQLAGDFTCLARIDFLISTGESELDACRLVSGSEFADICGPDCNPDLCDSDSTVTTPPPTISPTAAPVDPPTPSPTASPTDPPEATLTNAPTDAPASMPVKTLQPTDGPVTTTAPRCGCNDCESALNLLADGSTCGERIDFLMAGGATEEDACLQISNVEYAFICGPSCDITRCDGKNPPLEPKTPIYCYKDYDNRKRFENVWGDFIVEAKGDPGLETCGPSANSFTDDTVSVEGDELKLQYKKIGDKWEASEVRIVMPQEQMPFQYGKYSWNVKSIQVKNTITGMVRQNYLPPSLVLGMFTWDATEDFTVRQNQNHEVDVELGRMGDPDSEFDAQFLVQPPEDPNLYRFSTKDENGKYQQAPQSYEFTWNPALIAWETGVGVDHFYSSEQAITLGLEDYVQCLPANVEVRINLWNLDGAAVDPLEMSDEEVVEVIIDDFTYTPTGLTGVEDGGFCTKDCQCQEGSECVPGGNRCAPSSIASGNKKQ